MTVRANLLYNVLSRLSSNPAFRLRQNGRCEHDKTLDKLDYYRISIPSFKMDIPGFKLDEVHLSIYKELDSINPKLGPCHFTATFDSSAGERFRIHLFLNTQDELACDPTWELWDDETRFVHEDNTPGCFNELKNLVYKSCVPYLQELRHQQHLLENKLSKKYKEDEKKLASSSKNNPGYAKCLNTVSKSIKELREISENSDWSQTETFLKKLRDNLHAASGPSHKALHKTQEKDNNSPYSFFYQMDMDEEPQSSASRKAVVSKVRLT